MENIYKADIRVLNSSEELQEIFEEVQSVF